MEQEFNSLDAQRESCEAYVASQRAEGWLLVPDRYDDGGISGATLERPALKRLLADIEAHKVDVVVVYKIDRLSRALMDFAKLVEVFDRNNVTFVSVTQSFNTTTSMGRLTLNILLSFAQFEREVIGERIRDKFAASRRKGMWMGGWAPLGYDIKDRKLIVNEREAKSGPLDLYPLCPRYSPTAIDRDAGKGRHPQQARQADRQGLSLPRPEQPRLPGRSRAQGLGLPWRTRPDYRKRPLGTSSRADFRKPAKAHQAPIGTHASHSEGYSRNNSFSCKQ